MSDVYLLQNQDKLFLGKQKDWLGGRDRNSLFRTPHKDEAVNQLVEISAKDYTQRITLLLCKVDERGLPVIPAEDLPPAHALPAKEASEASQHTEAPQHTEEPQHLAEQSLSSVEE